jgi:hypothetical protein
MSHKKKPARRYAVCIKNSGNEASLERNKLYVVLPDSRKEADGLARIIDEDGEDYLYPADWFVGVEVPKRVERSPLE